MESSLSGVVVWGLVFTIAIVAIIAGLAVATLARVTHRLLSRNNQLTDILAVVKHPELPVVERVAARAEPTGQPRAAAAPQHQNQLRPVGS